MSGKVNSAGERDRQAGTAAGAAKTTAQSALGAGQSSSGTTLARAKAENRSANQAFVASMSRLSSKAIQVAATRRGYNDLWCYPSEVTKRTLDAVYNDALRYAQNVNYYQNASQVHEGFLRQWKLINPPPRGYPSEFTPEEAAKLAAHYEGYLQGWVKAADLRWGGYDISRGRAEVRNGRIVGYTQHKLIPGAEGLTRLATWLNA